MSESHLPPAKGRGSSINPPNRFARLALQDDLEYLAGDEEALESLRNVPTEYFEDDTQSIISENDSPDIPFRYSLNPYRGCLHGCSYCFARPTHEYLGLGAGLDFEAKIFVKRKSAALLRDFLSRKQWVPETIAISGVTDCYQPIERSLRLTRDCLQVALEARQPITVVTKNALVLRDVDLLGEMAQRNIVRVAMSVTTLEQSLTKTMEPRTSSPTARMRTIRELTATGVPVHVLVAPVIPGLNDFEIPRILEAVREAGAASASYILLRLPLTVEPVFLEWLQRCHPEKKAKVESLLRDTRGGKLYESGFGVRMRGRGEIANQIEQTFALFARKWGMLRQGIPLDTSGFRPPLSTTGQGWLF